MISHLRPAVVVFGVLTVLCGAIYPAGVTAIASLAFPAEADGSLVTSHGKVVGSRLIGQSFTAPRYFWGRPSATAPMAANGNGSSGSNQGPLNPALLDAARARVAALRAADPTNTMPVPVDLVTASASGLDPDMSLAAARYQVARVARARGIDAASVQAVIERLAERPTLGFLGEPKVNVLALNLALDEQ
ncbi:potassium-transporting ATPase subunit KdpC [Pseudoduganella plicata]|uniref:Potassium-transporting ATPase KdpC subunit n=1 Tax=Pseudoduganella plicata TaxID=321984 RepID=A0A4P7BFE9_9BURK|nr:potassium-transporting ATPase subunit KdpC [Pseudoduganella plicata]QBQ36902.1 potassium-transporting ATPase subunit KdpC [Pseudoduganella plicata]GGZ07473.1 potassium-transporting ATPase KdpC subunit [Pseudoduganella plicata]